MVRPSGHKTPDEYLECFMAGEKKLDAPVTLFAAIESEQHAALREIAFSERRSLADVVREALTGYLKIHAKKRSSTRSRPVAAARPSRP